MKARLLVAVATAIFSVAFAPLTASAAPPVAVVIHIVPNPFGNETCPPYVCGTWDLTSDSFTDSGIYKSTDGDVAPPDRSPFSPGPLFESFMLTNSRFDGTFAVRAEERLLGTFPNLVQTGVWQIQSGTGVYAASSGHGDVTRSLSPITLILTGVIGKVSSS